MIQVYKKQLWVVIALIVIGYPLQAQDAFITTWKTDNFGESPDNEVEIHANAVNYNIYWEEVDDSNNNGTLINQSGKARIVFPHPGIYKVEITTENLFSLYSDSRGDVFKLLSIDQWGSIKWISMRKAFYNCINMTSNATDIPDLSRVDDMHQMFSWASLFDLDISNWDVSNVKDMSYMFLLARSFNQDISKWDVSGVTSMSHMFYAASSFDQDISKWNFEQVVDLNNMVGSSNFSTRNYDKLLVRLSQLDEIPVNQDFIARYLKFCTANDARNKLINDYGWTFREDSYDCIYSNISSRSGSVYLNFDDQLFIGLGQNDEGYFKDWMEISNGFILLDSFPGPARSSAVSFVIDTLGYVGLGIDEAGNYLSDFYQYDPSTDTWTQIADFGGGPRTNAIAFSIGEYGYVGTGLNADDEQADFWKYDPVEDSWTELPDWGKDKRQGAFAFVVGDKAYVGGGYYFDSFTFQLSDIQEYESETGGWTEKIFADGLNLAVNDAAAFSLYGNGYIAYGNQGALIKYNPRTNEVENLGDYFELGDSRKDPVAYVQGDSAFVGLGSYGFLPTEYSNEFSAYYEPNVLPADIVLSVQSFPENSGENVFIGEFSTEDPDEPFEHTYHLLSTDESEENDFEIIGNGLYALTSFDFETQNEYSILVRTVDSREGAFEKEYTISITDSNDPPVALALSSLDVDESNEETVIVGTFEVTDLDVFDSHQYTLIDGDGSNDADNDHFFISGSDLSVINPNFEVQPLLNVNVQVTDGGGESFSQSFTIDVNDVNEAPTDITLDIDEISESVLIGTNVGTLSSEDEDNTEQTYTYFVESDTFRVIDEKLSTIAAFDLETDKLYTLEITTEDQGGLTFSKVFKILVTSEPLGVGSPDDFTIYPNPATDYLILKDDYARKVSLFSLKGEKLFDLPIEKGFRKIDVSLLESGVYMLRLYGNEGIKDYKLIKQ